MERNDQTKTRQQQTETGELDRTDPTQLNIDDTSDEDTDEEGESNLGTE